MPVKQHLHIYAKGKVRPVKPDVFYCQDPECTHFQQRERLVNKKSICPGCGGEMILTIDRLRRSVPKCDMCSDTNKSKEMKKIAANPSISSVLGGLE